jgi:hypothetical protein
MSLGRAPGEKMADPALIGLAPECGYRVAKVLCPHKALEATITAATWKLSQAGWTSWTVVDCSLLPAGWIGCDRACLAALESAEPAYTPR